LSALAQLRGIAIRNAVCGLIGLPPATAVPARDSAAVADTAISDADLRIPVGDAPVPVHVGQSRPQRIALSLPKTSFSLVKRRAGTRG
jgi:hypothetical protein